MANSTKLLIFTLVILSLSIVFVGCMPDFSFLDDGGGTTAYEHPGSASTTARTTAKTTAKTSVIIPVVLRMLYAMESPAIQRLMV